jgi:hypothetical protein
VLNKTTSINLQLGISAAVVIIAAFLYGANPSTIMPNFFNFQVENIHLKNIFRAIMGLYLAFGFYWAYSIINPKHHSTAIISNILFMGGLALGRFISLILDGISNLYLTGMVLEFVMLFWGLYNYKLINKN